MKRKESASLQTRNLLTETESRLIARERALFNSYRLCPSDLAILNRLHKKGPKTVNQIAPKVGLTSGSMTSAIQRLLKRDFITTKRDQKDGRKVWVELTKLGKQTLRTLAAEREKALAPIFSELSDREGKVLVALLEKIRKASRTKP